jgi:hypothetical protein
MKRTPTNFGPYESEYRQRVTWGRRWLLILLQLALVALGVVLAGLFLFPMGPAVNESTGELVQPFPAFPSAAAAPAPAASQAAPKQTP